MKMRLSKALSTSGVASRRKADVLIEAGRVRVNGSVEQKPYTPVDPLLDLIEVNGKKIHGELKIYYLLNKPIGLLCAHEKGQKTIYDLFRGKSRLFSAGRLDKMTSGLLLVTNDGDFVQKLIHPSANIEKEYIARVNRQITNLDIKKISAGCQVGGAFVKPKLVIQQKKDALRIVVMEGKKHEVRLLVKLAGLETIELKRTRIGKMLLGNLPVGDYRILEESELKRFFS